MMQGPRKMLLAACLLLMTLSGCGDDTDEFNSEGTVSAPILFSSVPFSYDGQVGIDNGASFYKVETTTNSGYTTSVSNLTDDVDLIVYGVNGFSDDNPLCVSINVGNTDESCTGTVSGNEMYIRVKLIGDVGTNYTLQVLVGT